MLSFGMLASRRLDGAAQPRVLVRLGQPAFAATVISRDQLGEHLGALLILRALAVHDVLEL
jgi:hypothetical protein